MKQTIAFRRFKVYTSKVEPSIPDQNLMRKIVSISEELKEFGYAFSKDVIGRLTEEDLTNIHKEIIIGNLKNNPVWGRGKSGFSVLYPGFPQQVMDLSDYELWENARRIYDGEVGIEDFVTGIYVENELENLENEFKSKFAESVKILKPMCEAEFVKIPIDICKSGNSIAGDTKDELVWFLGNYPDLTLPT